MSIKKQMLFYIFFKKNLKFDATFLKKLKTCKVSQPFPPALYLSLNIFSMSTLLLNILIIGYIVNEYITIGYIVNKYITIGYTGFP